MKKRVIVITITTIILLLVVQGKFEVIIPSEIKITTSQYLKEKYPNENFMFINKINSRVAHGGEIITGYSKDQYGVADFLHGNSTVRVAYTAYTDYTGDEIFDNFQVKKVETDLEKYITSNFGDDVYDMKLMVSDIPLSAAYYWAGSYFKKDHVYHDNIKTFFNKSDSRLVCRIYVKDRIIDSAFEKKMDDLNMKLAKMLGNGATDIEWLVGNKQNLEYFKEKYPIQKYYNDGGIKFGYYPSSWYTEYAGLEDETVKLDLIYIFMSYSEKSKVKYSGFVFRNGDYKVSSNHDPISY